MDFPKLELTVINFGKVSTGKIYVENIYDNYFYAKLDSSFEISPQNGTNIILMLRQKNCTREEVNGNCIENLGINGVQNFTVTFYCEFCKEKYINFTTPICIWENSSGECNYE